MNLISATQFKLLNRGRKVKRAEDVCIRKLLAGQAEVIEAKDEDRSIRFTISTDAVDREQDSIDVKGWDLRNFRDNPVVLWAHDSSRLPIGRALDVGVVDGALRATVKFVPPETPVAGEFADAVFRLAKSGFLSATSVGFRPTKWDFTSDPKRGGDDWFPGIDFQEQELVELSIVTVPANPEALIEPGFQTTADTPPETGEEVTGLDPDEIRRRAAAVDARHNEEQTRARARRRRAFQLAVAQGGSWPIAVPNPQH